MLASIAEAQVAPALEGELAFVEALGGSAQIETVCQTHSVSV
jgi:hypothetical protein